ncbi:MAG TPA: hypothetical protein VF867_00130 [Arthrobacter sp.]
MTWMNEYEVERAVARFGEDTPYLRRGARVLYSLMEWTNSHSDGWPYWQKPARAANKLMGVLASASNTPRGGEVDITDADLKKALSPIKAFLTRQGVDHNQILKED